MISHHIPVISPQSGQLNDGSIIGYVKESLITKVLSDTSIADNIYAIRKNVTGNSFSFDDISTEAASEVPNSFLPFGTSAQMTAGDELFLACETTISEMYVDIDTPANWVGTFELRYSANGTTANKTVVNLVDSSNGFRNADGVYRLTFDMPTDIVAFSPVPEDIPSRKWFIVKPILASVVAAPQLRRVWLFHDDIKYNDVTAIHAGDVTVAPTAGTFLPQVGSVVLLAFNNKAYGLERYVFGSQANVQTRVWEYLASDDTWKTLTVTDASSDMTLTPPAQPTKYAVRWTIPMDWGGKTLSHTLLDNSILNTEGFWARIRTLSVSNFAQTTSPALRTRAKQFGNANVSGIQMVDAKTFKIVCITRIGSVNGTGTTTLQLVNFTTGVGVSFEIPASPTLPFNIDITDFALADNDIYGLLHTAGTRVLTDVEIILQ